VIAGGGHHPIAAYILVQRELRKPWLPTFTSLLDVSLVSATLLACA